MEKLTIEDLSLSKKRVVMRVDFNVPLDEDQNITDATRIEASLPSIRYVLDQGGSLVLMSHLGRPKFAPTPELSLAPVAKMLSILLERPVQMAPDCIGYAVDSLVKKLKPGEVMLLENLRFHRAEEHPEEDPSFAKQLASYGDVYVNDAFGSAHRKHSSTYTIASHFPGRSAAGFLLEKEIRFIGDLLLKGPKRPFYALIGGAKISSKIGIIKALLDRVDTLLIGGGMAYTFLKAQKMAIGDSLCEEDLIPVAKEILERSASKKVPLLLPIDFNIAKECSEDAPSHYVEIKEGIPTGFQGFDIGPKTIAVFSSTLKKAKTILWNGPVGVFEFKPFSKGTQSMAEAIASSGAISVVGGGDSIAAINEMDLGDQFTHLSTGGGATLEYIEHGTLPGIEVLSDKKMSVKN